MFFISNLPRNEFTSKKIAHEFNKFPRIDFLNVNGIRIRAMSGFQSALTTTPVSRFGPP